MPKKMPTCNRLNFFFTLLLLLVASPIAPCNATEGSPTGGKAGHFFSAIQNEVGHKLSARGLTLGNQVFIRILKLPGILELWVKKDTTFELFSSYPICTYSGYPGPKLREGDLQSPEGFYHVRRNQLNPTSSYHLAFDIGYPNLYDLNNHRDGSNIMIHGGCSSTGCFAMGDKKMEEIYVTVQQALLAGQQKVEVHIFPFALTKPNLERFSQSPWINFWKSMAPMYIFFEKRKQLPIITVVKNSYSLN
ncbi:L,D-transpeptidase family protein [Desulfogranum marinum]|uniref:L,D-transpeptidase family protein n=1 Tax=Desulfogranum marinum TaxID=453220 RepID=UPI0019642B46|nr:murein L,D-transpeptidase family protein [Desulfogranum marinum]MBM9513528.1 murein L,D-transpeptidase [Desulfogranum marinum]